MDENVVFNPPEQDDQSAQQVNGTSETPVDPAAPAADQTATDDQSADGQTDGTEEEAYEEASSGGFFGGGLVKKLLIGVGALILVIIIIILLIPKGQPEKQVQVF